MISPVKSRHAPLVCLLLIIIAGCRASAGSEASVQAPEPAPRLVHQTGGTDLLDLSRTPVPGMTLAQVRAVSLPAGLETTGQVAFDDRRVATIVSRVAGRIEETRVSQWDYVHKGEPILKLYSPDFMTAEAEYLEAGTTAKLSSTPGIGGQSTARDLIIAARRKLELLGMSDADIEAIRDPSPSTWIRATISGTVTENKAIRGTQVNPGDTLFSLAALDQVWIVADIYEDQLARIHVGQSLEATTTAYPHKVFYGSIARISPEIDPTTHTLQIRCAMENPDLKLKPQMLARVNIATARGIALVIPEEALVFDTDRYYVYVAMGGGRFARRAVELAPAEQGQEVRIARGLMRGEQVVAAESIQVNALWHQANGESS
jgi:Cu(I)/Ag(I) efflux system membrane fusion protein